MQASGRSHGLHNRVKLRLREIAEVLESRVSLFNFGADFLNRYQVRIAEHGAFLIE